MDTIINYLNLLNSLVAVLFCAWLLQPEYKDDKIPPRWFWKVLLVINFAFFVSEVCFFKP